MAEISQKSDDFFTVRSYLMDDGADAIRTWYERQPEEIQADFLVALTHLREMPRKWWRKKRFEELGKRGQTACVGLVRIRVWADEDDERTHIRILGYLGPGERTLTMLMAFNKDDDPDYSMLCSVAHELKRKVEDEHTRSCECAL